MPTKISQLDATASVTELDLIQIIDVEDPLMANSGTNKKVTALTLANQLATLTTTVPAAVQTALDLKAASASPTLTGSITIASNSSNGAALRITQTGSANALLVEDKENPDSTPFTVNADGRVIIGSTVTATSSSNVVSNLHIIGNTDDTSSINLSRYSSDSSASALYFSKSRSITAGSFSLVSNGDNLGALHFDGSCDAFKQTRAASIIAQVDGTPGTDDMPGRIIFSTTADGTSTPSERMRISNSGVTTISGTGIINSSSSDAALRITQTGSGNALVVEDSTHPDSTPLVVDSNGKLLVGTSTARVNYYSSLTPEGIQDETGTQSLFKNSNNATGPAFYLGKSRGATANSNTVVQDNDQLGAVVFFGADGTNVWPGAQIIAAVDGTPGANDIPGRLVFSTTADGSASATERMRITSAGNVGIGTTSPDSKLTISSNDDIAACRITQTGSGHALLIEDASGDASPFIINGSGHVGVGTTPEIHGITLSHSGENGVRSKSFNGNNIFSGYRANGTQASPTVVANDNRLVQLAAFGYNGTTYANAANIAIDIDGSTISSSSMPGRILFSTTPSGTTVPVERMRISNSGVTTISGTGIINSSSSDAALRITQTGIGNALVVEDSTNPDSTPFVINDTGRVLIGQTQNITGTSTFNRGVQTANIASVQLGNYDNTEFGESITFNKSRGTVSSPHVVPNTGDTIGELVFAGSDGVKFVAGASIRSSVDGTPALNDMPGRLIFTTTADGTSTPVERMRISSNGNVGIGTATTTSARLTVSNDTTITSQDALRVVQTGTGNALVVHDVASDTTPFIVDQDGQVAIRGSVNSGSALTVNGTGDSAVVMLGDDFVGLNIQSARNSSNDHAIINLWGSRGTTATKTAVQNGDILGTLSIRGYDGNSWESCAAIRGEVDGAVSDGVMSGRLTFTTRSGTTGAEHMRITSGGNIGIGTTNPSSSAKLEVSSTTSGFLPPRMTTGQRNLISSPVAGLMIYNTISSKLNFYNGTAWQEVTSTTAA
jgi:hypothetical protein